MEVLMAARIRTLIPFAASIAAIVALSACHNSDSNPTGSHLSTLSGTVISGAAPMAIHTQGSAVGLAGVSARLTSTGQTTLTDSSGNFTLSNVASGDQELDFERADIHAHGHVSVPAGSALTVTVSIVGSDAVIVPGGGGGEEIEGIVQSVDAVAGTLTVADLRLGTVTVSADDKTDIRHGNLSIPLSGVAPGMRVHVKALIRTDGSYLATQIFVQDNPNTVDLTGIVATLDVATSSFMLTTATGGVSIATDGSTEIQRNGQPASFSAVTPGSHAEVEGTRQPDGSVLASRILLES
jgi:hypothetical protein